MQYMLFKALSPKEYKTYTAIRLSMEEGKFTVRVFTGGMTCTEKVYMKILRFSVRQWIVLIGAALFQCALVGILVNSAGLFLAEVRLERQYSMSMISAHNTIRSVSGAVLGAFLVHLFHKKNKPVFLFLCVASIACGYLLMTIDLPELAWFVIPVLLCPSASIGIVAVPYMLAPWFSTCSGFASGFAMAFSGVGGVIFNPIAATLIEKYGWRQAIVILAAIMFGVSLLGLYMVFHVSPQMQQRVDMEGSIKHRGLKETGRKKDIRKFMKCQIVALQ